MTERTSIFNIVLYLTLGIFYSANGRLAPDFIYPCNNLSRECLINATKLAIPEFVKGIPDLGIPQLDPFQLENVPLNLDGFDVTFVKGEASGFKNCIPDNVVLNLEERYFKLDFHCNITIKGYCKALGQLAIFPIDGAGDISIKLTNFRMKMHINSKYTKDNKGLHHFGVKNYKYNFDYGDNVVFDLKNLFKQSKELGETASIFLNENWKIVTQEFGKPVMDYSVKLAVDTIIKFFNKVPCEELLHVPFPKLVDN